MNVRKRGAGAHTLGGIAGLVGVVLALAGLSALGDTPDPHDAAAPTAAYFVEHRESIFTSTTLVALAGIAIIVFLAVLNTRLTDAIARPIAFTAGIGIVALLELNELIYATLSYSIGRDSPSTAKSLFAMTIVASVVLSAFVALLLGTVALRRGSLPRWFSYASAAGAVLVVPGLVSFGDTGLLYPDVQQQVVAQVFLLWLVVAAIVIWRSRPTEHDRSDEGRAAALTLQ
jgi:hypothetical protein